MTRYIEHIVEPHSLQLYWQAIESKSRSRFHVGRLVKRDAQVVLEYDFEGEEFAKASSLGFKGYPAFPLKSNVYDTFVLEAFIRRLPPRNRSDFSKYLQLRALSPTSELSDFALLGYTGAKLPNDGFELVHSFENAPKTFELLIEVAGFRHESEVSADELQVGDKVAFVPDPSNKHDCLAIRMELNGRMLGFVPRGQLDVIHKALVGNGTVHGEVFRKNGSPERPLIYILTKINS